MNAKIFFVTLFLILLIIGQAFAQATLVPGEHIVGCSISTSLSKEKLSSCNLSIKNNSNQIVKIENVIAPQGITILDHPTEITPFGKIQINYFINLVFLGKGSFERKIVVETSAGNFEHVIRLEIDVAPDPENKPFRVKMTERGPIRKSPIFWQPVLGNQVVFKTEILPDFIYDLVPWQTIMDFMNGFVKILNQSDLSNAFGENNDIREFGKEEAKRYEHNEKKTIFSIFEEKT